MSKNSLLCVIIAVCLFSGCGDNQKLTGKVVFSDGEPLTTGTVLFSSGTFLSRSFIKPDGSFAVGSLKEDDGIPPGKYKVYITDAIEAVPNPKMPGEEMMKPLIAGKYASRDTTPLEIEIPGEKVYNITVERP